MKAAVVAVSVTLTVLVSSCSEESSSSQATADCQEQVRADGVVYTSHGYTEQPASRHGVADRARCDDVGQDAAGSVFPEDPEQVTTWSFPGYPPEQVVGVRFDKDSFAVFVADTVADAERERIYRELGDD